MHQIKQSKMWCTDKLNVTQDRTDTTVAGPGLSSSKVLHEEKLDFPSTVKTDPVIGTSLIKAHL